MQLQDKIAIVTGAGQGIGKGIALRLAREGSHVVINHPSASTAEKAEEVATLIREMGRKSIAIQADVSKAAQVEAMVQQTVEIFGRLDIQVNNAGVDPHIPFFELTEEQWDFIINTNLKGNFFCAQSAARAMAKTGGGKIIIISSIHGMQTYKRMTAYAAAKGGLNAMTRQLAIELGPYHINVNCIAPGAVQVEKNYIMDPNFDPHAFDHEIPVGSIGNPDDIAGAVVFFASDDARYISGQVLTVDGGTSTRILLGVSDKKIDVVEQVVTMKPEDWLGEKE
ncbi:MAG: SDR family oxidoreductase [Chloroflexi bacterium]|nr:SDR family oxidoreductase [Chloroflexota bacterium]MCC6891707.1 SDR family oxidoreductase [Anaerolineae bacterium]